MTEATMNPDDLLHDLKAVLAKHNLKIGMLIIPLETDFLVMSLSMSTEHIRHVGHMLTQNVAPPDTLMN